MAAVNVWAGEVQVRSGVKDADWEGRWRSANVGSDHWNEVPADSDLFEVPLDD